MAKVSGLDGFDKDAAALSAASAQRYADRTVEEIGREMERRILQNYRAMVPREHATGVLENSITHVAKTSETKQGAFGHAGVYHIQRILADAGEDPRKAIPAPLRAYWLEYGVQPHTLNKGARAARRPTKSGRARTAKGQTGQPHPGVRPIPFIARAQAAGEPEMEKIAAKQFNRFVDKVKAND